MDKQDAFGSEPKGDRETLLAHLLQDLGPRILRWLRQKLRRHPIQDPEGFLDEAAIRLLGREDLAELTQEDVDRLFWAYCRLVAQEHHRDDLRRDQRGERSVPERANGFSGRACG